MAVRLPSISILKDVDRNANVLCFGTACFKAGNGDVENAPAIDALPSYNIEEKNGAVYITGEEETIKSSRRKPNIRISGAAGQEKVVIVGHGSGGLATLEALREGGFKGSITVIGRYVAYRTFNRILNTLRSKGGGS